MPRFFVRHERTPDPVRSFRVYAPWFVDPNWFLAGSSIEKMVMAELDRRGIYFIYRNQTNHLGGFVDPTWEADFLIPQHKIWIEVQGSYFHSLEGQIAKDSLRFAAIEQAGWTPLFWWEFDIRTRLNDLMDAVPAFYQPNLALEREARRAKGTSQDLRFKVGSLSDQLVGLRKSLQQRTMPPQLTVRHAERRTPS